MRIRKSKKNRQQWTKDTKGVMRIRKSKKNRQHTKDTNVMRIRKSKKNKRYQMGNENP